MPGLDRGLKVNMQVLGWRHMLRVWDDWGIEHVRVERVPDPSPGLFEKSWVLAQSRSERLHAVVRQIWTGAHVER